MLIYGVALSIKLKNAGIKYGFLNNSTSEGQVEVKELNL